MGYCFLGQAAHYSRRERLAHTFAVGHKKDAKNLTNYLEKRYQGTAILTKNGRSALCLALKNLLPKGSEVIANGFTCYAVYEAVKTAGMTPVFADINKEDLNFTIESIKKVLTKNTKAIIIQNTLGNPVNIVAIEKFAKDNDLIIIEDLAHCAGLKYADGREAGTVGAATILSFGKDKSIDTISGGALIVRTPVETPIAAPSKAPKFADTFRTRFYPLIAGISRGLQHIKLGGPWLKLMLKLHFIERSADNKLDLTRRPNRFAAKLALKQLQSGSKMPLRKFVLVNNREELLKKLKKQGFYFDGFWYERPISPERYYKKVKFDEVACPVATEVAASIINIPTHYSSEKLQPAIKLIKEYTR
jgi:dTDP-4-amino-4,6-dideoxygalactose transaminase